MQHKTFRTLLSILLLSLLGLPAFAQNGSNKVYGIVKDNVNEPQIGATVVLKSTSDVFVAGGAADADGNFILSDIANGSYKLVVSYVGFDDFTRTITVAGTELNVGIIKMTVPTSTTLTEVKIEGKAPPVEQKQDTTQFNANSFKVNPDATAEDLLRKMPGMDLSTGTPQTQGENISKVLVDGKPFFGTDATNSLRNLPAEVIDKIQVYDEKSDQSQFTGFDDGNTSKTINIITRPGKKQGIFGKFYAGGGTDGTKNDDDKYDSKYNAGGNINFFEGDRRISLIGQTNNINIQNFSPQDLVGVSGTSGGRGGGGRGGGMGGGATNNFMTGQQAGVSKTNAVGFNYSDKWGKKVDVTASYFFNNSSNFTQDSTERNYVLPSQAGQTYNEISNATTNNYNHRFNMRLNYMMDSSNSILFVPSLSFQNNKSNSLVSGQTFLNDTAMLNSSVNNYNSTKTGNNLSSMLLFRHKFKKKGRTFSVMLNGGTNSNDGNSTLYAPVYSEQSADTINQYATSTSNGWNINSNATYTEPLSKRSFLQVQYGLNYQESKADIRTSNYNYLNQGYTDLDTLLSNKFTTNYLTNKGGLSYRYADSNFNFNVGVDMQNANLDNERILPYNNTLTRSFNNILPNARFQYNFTKKKSLRLYYNTSTTAPSVSQLQDVVNNSNPLQLSTGNPNLVQSYQHRLFLRYSAANTNAGSTFFAMLMGSMQQNYIGNSTIIAQDSTTINGFNIPAGGQYTRPENMGGYYNLRSFVTYGLPITALKTNLNMNASAGFVRTPGMINLQKNYANNSSAGFGLVLSSNISEKIDFTLSSNSNYNIIRNTLNASSNSEYFNQISRFSLNYIFWKGIVFNTELNHQFYTGLTAGYNQNYLLWNVSLAKKLFKKQQGEIKLTVYDLLDQNKSITPTVTETYTQYVKANVLQRYFMLTFTYNLRFFKGGASMKDTDGGDNKGGRRFPGAGFPPPGTPPPPGGGGGFVPGSGMGSME
jgi:hypothetical protein